MKYTTVLWDLDGTIIDSQSGVFASFRHTFKTLGIEEPSPSQLKTFLGPPLRESFGEHMGLDAETVEQCLQVYKEFYHAEGAIDARVYEGVLEVVAASRAAGATVSLATSKAITGVELVGNHFGFLDQFDFLGTADNEKNRLTKSEVLEYTLKELANTGADLSKVVLVGDRIHDVEGAREHNLDVVLVKWGFGDASEWSLADAVVENPAELAQFLGL